MKKTLVISKLDVKEEKNIGKWLDKQDRGVASLFNSSNIVSIEEHEDCWYILVDDEIIYF